MGYKGKKIIAIIPARGGSKGIPNKNIKLICGQPLISWTINQILGSKYIDEVYVSTDNDEIKSISKSYGAKTILRPDDISGDTASTESALLHASKELKDDYDIMILFQCTSPLRYSKQIDEAIEQLFNQNADSLLTGYKNDAFFWDNNGKSINYDFNNRPRRQDKSWEFVENGSFYIFKKEILLKNQNRLGGIVSQYIMPKWMSFEIDESFDFDLVEYYMNNKFLNNDFDKIKIKMVLFDVDGIFTDGSVYLDSSGNEMLQFSRIDGKGIELLRNKSILVGVISSEDNLIARKRMEKLKIEEVHLGISDKIKVYNSIKEKYSLDDCNICFCGDDIQDIPILKQVGYSACPKNALPQVKDICDYKSEKIGGQGFIREIVEKII